MMSMRHSILKENMDEIPLLIKEVQKDLPQQFQEVRFGCRDLKADGYDLEHIKVEGKLSTLKGKLNLVEPLITRLELDEARDILEDINTQLDDMLELVEHEVMAKTKVDHDGIHQRVKNELDIDVKEINKYFKRRPLNVQYIKDKVNRTVILMNKYEQEAYEILQAARLTEVMIYLIYMDNAATTRPYSSL